MLEKLSPFFERIKITGEPQANKDATVICGRARFTVLTNHMIRLEWSDTSTFEDRATFAFPNRVADVPPFTVERFNEGSIQRIALNTDNLIVSYTDDGQPFSADNLSITFTFNQRKVVWKPGMVNEGNLRGTRRTLDQCASSASLTEGLLSHDGWSLYDDSGLPVWTVDHDWIEARPDSHVQDWYFFAYGHDYKTALKDYLTFGGDIPQVPRFVLGAWWSRFWAYSADDLLQLVKDFDAHDLPLDVLVVDMDWHTPDGWTGYTWNRDLFPDPEAFLAKIHDQGLHVTLNLHPAEGIQKHEAAYAEFAARLDHDTSTGEGIKFHCTDPAFVQHYFELLHHPMEEQGVDFWWLDWQQGDSTEIKNLDPLVWLNHLHFRDSIRRGKRPMLYSRWGGLGNHRYPIGFSGDTYATWDALRFLPYFTATAANVGYGWWSHDIGGHFGATEPELYARWVQFGAVSPCLRLHSTKELEAERRPWAFPESVFKAAQSAFKLRYQLLSYLYSSARAASTNGLSLCTPMYYDYPESDDAYLARDQYFLGDQMIAAPVVTPVDPRTGLAAVNVWIPDGTWTDFTTRDSFVGPRWVTVQADLNRIPIFVKAGGIIPLATDLKRTAHMNGSQFVLKVFAGADGSFDLYEDDGTTENYQSGSFEITPIRLNTGNDLKLTIGAADGNCPELSPVRTWEVQFNQVVQPVAVMVNGQTISDWVYNLEQRTLTLTIYKVNRRDSIEIVVETLTPSTSGISVSPVTAPFAQYIEYDLPTDTRKQLAIIIVAPPSDGSAFDVDLKWTLETNGSLETFPQQFHDCNTEQIIHSPFAESGNFAPTRWQASVTITWQGQVIESAYASHDSYPAISQWQTLIYNRDSRPTSLTEVLAGKIPTASWEAVRQTHANTFNSQQPFGVVLLEQDRQRIISGESLEACLKTSLLSAEPQSAMLLLQFVGDAECYLNGELLNPTTPVSHATFQPMFYSWMPPQQSYYEFPLRAGQNELVVVSHPNREINWWGVGAIVLDHSGNVLTGVTSGLQGE